MKLFKGGGGDKSASAPQATPSPALANPSALAPPAPEEPAEPDITAVLDASVKEISEKLGRLATQLEGQEENRTGFENKLARMEDRMRKLSSLTEMISSQYNPFVGDAPTERDALPSVEAGLGVVVTPKPEASGAEHASSGTHPTHGLAPPEHELADRMDGEFDAESDGDDSFDESDAPPAGLEDTRIHLDEVPPGFEASAIALKWADVLLLHAASRDSAMEIVSYYHRIGWLGEVARDQLLAYMDGIAAPPKSEEEDEWRTNTDLHERSLLFVEKLKWMSRSRRGRR